MKLNKKFLAGFTAMTLAVAPMSVYADGYETTGTGTITSLETTIYNVVLPTSKSVDFKVDPYGLLELQDEKALDQVMSGAPGTVTSSATAVVNKSSVGINVSIDMYLDNADASNGAVELGTYEEVSNGAADLYLYAMHLSGASLETVVTDSAIDADLIGNPVSDKAVSISNVALQIKAAPVYSTEAAINITKVSGSAHTITLGGIPEAYMVTGDGAKYSAVLSEGAVTYTSKNVYAFAITGYANPESDKWTTITGANGELELTVKYTISEYSDVKTAYNTGVDSFGTLHVGIVNNSTNGGITDLTKVTDLEVNGVSTAPYHLLENGAFMLVSGQWALNDVITFNYDGVAYKLIVR